MTDNIKPDHYRTGEIDLYEAFSQIFPHNEYRAGMQMIAMRYMFRDKIDRVEDLGKSIYTLERLKEKEIEHAGETEIISTKDGDIVLKSDKDSKSVYFLKRLLEQGYKYIARDKDDCLWVYGIAPTKGYDVWASCPEDKSEKISNYSFIEAQWTDNEPTRISKLLATYQNGGENGN